MTYFIRYKNDKYFSDVVKNMAEASIVAFGSVAVVTMTLAVVCFALRGKGHHSEIPHTARHQS